MAISHQTAQAGMGTAASAGDGTEDAVARTMRLLAPARFDDVAAERRHRQERLAAGFRLLAHLGLTTGVAGHISARDPEHPERFWVNPLAVPFSAMRVRDLVLVDADGSVVEGDALVNAAAFAIHSSIHAANPRVVSACHSHAPWGRPWSATGRLIEATSQDACAFFGAQAVVPGFSGVVLGLDAGDRIAAAFTAASMGPAGVTVAVHMNHGHITIGESVDAAVFRFVLFEQMCQSQMRLEATGRSYHVLDDETAASTAEQVGSEYAAWLGFQSAYAEILARDPSVLD
ncbi:MAG TPA: class II aldolase/adducin family protein [Frankiaceae bacterium]|nr:class II aldolase/adducin family protein [Frankiaceae bacterium]